MKRKVGGQLLGPNHIRRENGVVWMQLSKGKETCLDENDYSIVESYRWYAVKMRRNWYAHAAWRSPDGSYLRLAMHRLILGGSLQTDHKDGNGLNNRRANLRPATYSQNQGNQFRRPSPHSPYKGVYFVNRPNLRKRWMAHIRLNYKKKNLGYYLTAEEAAAAYNLAAKEAFGEFAALNQIG